MGILRLALKAAANYHTAFANHLKDEEIRVTKLVIGTESLEIKAAKNRVLSNLKMLNERVQSLHQNPSICTRIYAFYTKKIEEQTGIFEWLNQYDQESKPEARVVCKQERQSGSANGATV